MLLLLNCVHMLYIVFWYSSCERNECDDLENWCLNALNQYNEHNSLNLPFRILFLLLISNQLLMSLVLLWLYFIPYYGCGANKVTIRLACIGPLNDWCFYDHWTSDILLINIYSNSNSLSFFKNVYMAVRRLSCVTYTNGYINSDKWKWWWIFWIIII